MEKRLRVLFGSNRQDNEQVKSILSEMEGVELEYVRESFLLEEVLNLPCVETEEGVLFCGPRSIRDFVGRQKKQNL